MATAFLLEWHSVDQEQFRSLIRELHWENKLFSGRMAHQARRRTGPLIVLEIWDSTEAFDQFWQTYLSQAVIKARLPPPVVKSWLVAGDPESSPNRSPWNEYQQRRVDSLNFPNWLIDQFTYYFSSTN